MFSRKKSIVMLCWLMLGATCGQVEERLWMQPIVVNGQPVRLFFDTGCGLPYLCLFEKTAGRLGIPFGPLPSTRSAHTTEVMLTVSDSMDVVMGAKSMKMPFLICPAPPTPEAYEDGIAGWPIFSRNIVRIDATSGIVTNLPSLPTELANWTRFKVQTNFGTLDLEWPGAGGKGFVVRIDTGSACGGKLAPAKWREWTKANSKTQRTAHVYYDTAGKLRVSEEGWADTLSFGELVLTGVPVREANPIETPEGPPECYAALGLAALKRLDLIVDGTSGIAYARAKTNSPPLYYHNCLGAVFVPKNISPGKIHTLVAHVVSETPASEAGIRNGDALLKIGTNDFSNWKTGMDFPRFSAETNGVKLEMTLKRGAKILTVAPTLRRILVPKSN